MRNQAGPVATARAANVVVFACAASAGIHAGLVPEHLRENPPLGVAFVIAAIVLVATGTFLALRPVLQAVRIAAVVLGGLIAAYIATRTTGIPLLDPDPEALDAVGVAAIVIELLGLTYALWLGHSIGRLPRRPVLQEVSS